MEVTHEFRNLDEGEMGPGWRWDAQLETWIGVRWDLDGAEIQYIVTWMELKRVLDGDEMPITGPVLDGGETRPWWTCDANLGTWMDVRLNLDGCEALIYRPEWRWNRTLIEMWRIYRDLDLGKKGQRWSWATIRVDGVETRPGWRWDMDIGTWMEMRHDLDGGDTWI